MGFYLEKDLKTSRSWKGVAGKLQGNSRGSYLMSAKTLKGQALVDVVGVCSLSTPPQLGSAEYSFCSHLTFAVDKIAYEQMQNSHCSNRPLIVQSCCNKFVFSKQVLQQN